MRAVAFRTVAFLVVHITARPASIAGEAVIEQVEVAAAGSWREALPNAARRGRRWPIGCTTRIGVR